MDRSLDDGVTALDNLPLDDERIKSGLERCATICDVSSAAMRLGLAELAEYGVDRPFSSSCECRPLDIETIAGIMLAEAWALGGVFFAAFSRMVFISDGEGRFGICVSEGILGGVLGCE